MLNIKRPMARLRAMMLLASLAASLILASTAYAAPSTLDDVMMEMVWEQRPSQYAGSASDSDFINSISGRRVWELTADDVLLASDATIGRVTWQGLYDCDNPPADEVMRLRIYDARLSDKWPGNIVYEELTTNHTREATGRWMAAAANAREFTYSMDLSESVLLEAEERYWVEITQIGSVDSAFFLVQAYPQEMRAVSINGRLTDWTSAGWAGTSFQLWSVVPEPASALLVGMAVGAGMMKPGRRRMRE